MSALEMSALQKAHETLRYAKTVAGDVQAYLLDGEDNHDLLTDGCGTACDHTFILMDYLYRTNDLLMEILAVQT